MAIIAGMFSIERDIAAALVAGYVPRYVLVPRGLVATLGEIASEIPSEGLRTLPVRVDEDTTDAEVYCTRPRERAM